MIRGERNRNVEVMTVTEFVSRSGYDRLTQNDIRYVNQNVVKEQEEDRLRRPIVNRCKKVVLTLFENKQKLV